VQVAHALRDLYGVRWAPAFAFIDQFGSEIHWSTLEQIARFRRARTKAEMWILFATSQYPRGLTRPGGQVNVDYAATITRMLGTDEWQYIFEGRKRNLLTAAEARDEWVNLMRWRLQHDLGYARSHAFTMKNTAGRDIYDMIFTSDHPAGDRIMVHLYGKAASEHEEMRQHALTLRRERRAEGRGEMALFPVTPEMLGPAAGQQDSPYVYEPPREPYRLPDR
jgi:three-Cys-motif partner protein